MNALGVTIGWVLLVQPAARPQSEVAPDDATASEIFERYTSALDRIESLHFDFRSSYVQGSSRRVFRGHFDFSPKSGRAFLKYTEVLPDLSPPIERYVQWDGAEGLFLRVLPERQYQTAWRTPYVPKDCGMTYLPSDHPCFPAFTTLSTFVEARRLVVEPVSRGDPALYRFTVVRGEPSRPNSWTVFFLSSDWTRPITEQRHYFRDPPNSQIDTPRGKFLPEGMELAGHEEARFLHYRKVFNRFAEVKGVWLPVAWHVDSPASDYRAQIEIEEESIETDRWPEHDHHLPLSETDFVFDLASRLKYCARDLKTPVDILPGGEAVTEETLDRCASLADDRVKTVKSSVCDIPFPSGCAANCVYVALQLLGRAESLPRILKGLEITPGRPWADLATVSRYLRARDVESIGLRPSVDLLRILKDAPAIVHVREGRTLRRHFVVMRDYRSRDDTVQIIDPLDPPRREAVSVAETHLGDGALVLGYEHVARVQARDRTTRLLRTSVLALTTLGVLSWLLVSLRRLRRRQGPGVGLGCALLAVVVTSCGDRAASVPVVNLQGPAVFDFGVAKETGRDFSHGFRLRNMSSDAQRVTKIRKTCTCLEAAADKEVIEPGGECVVTLTIDGTAVLGHREATAVVEFGDSRVKPILLKTKVLIEPDYAVVVSPRFLQVPKEAKAGERLSAELRLDEFSSDPDTWRMATEIEVEDGSRLRVVRMSPWTVRGWTFTGGYLRTASAMVEYVVPQGWSEGGTVVQVTFSRDPSGDGASKMSCSVPLRLYKL